MKNDENNINDEIIEMLKEVSSIAPTEQLSLPPKLLIKDFENHKKILDIAKIYTCKEELDITPLKALISLFQQIINIENEILEKYK